MLDIFIHIIYLYIYLYIFIDILDIIHIYLLDYILILFTICHWNYKTYFDSNHLIYF